MENTSRKKLTHVARDNNIFDTDQEIELIKQFFGPIPCFPCGNEICLATPTEILKLLKEIDTKQAVGFDMISPKLVKTAAHVL